MLKKDLEINALILILSCSVPDYAQHFKDKWVPVYRQGAYPMCPALDTSFNWASPVSVAKIKENISVSLRIFSFISKRILLPK